MPKPKKGSKKGTAIDVQFGATDGLSWARDEFQTTPEAGPQANGEEVPSIDNSSRMEQWRRYNKRVGQMESFRDAPQAVSKSFVPDDMPPPYVAFVKNVPHDITSEALLEKFPGGNEARIFCRDGKTFAHVELDSRDSLQTAMLLSGLMVNRRPIIVEIASSQHIDSIKQPDKMKSFDRDAMGNAPPPMRNMMSGSRGSRNSSQVDLCRDNMGIESPAGGRRSGDFQLASPVTDFSRDMFGSKKSPTCRDRVPVRGNKVASPNAPRDRTNFGSSGRDAPSSGAAAKGDWPRGGIVKQKDSKDCGEWRRGDAPATKPAAPAKPPAARDPKPSAWESGLSTRVIAPPTPDSTK